MSDWVVETYYSVTFAGDDLDEVGITSGNAYYQDDVEFSLTQDKGFNWTVNSEEKTGGYTITIGPDSAGQTISIGKEVWTYTVTFTTSRSIAMTYYGLGETSSTQTTVELEYGTDLTAYKAASTYMQGDESVDNDIPESADQKYETVYDIQTVELGGWSLDDYSSSTTQETFDSLIFDEDNKSVTLYAIWNPIRIQIAGTDIVSTEYFEFPSYRQYINTLVVGKTYYLNPYLWEGDTMYVSASSSGGYDVEIKSAQNTTRFKFHSKATGWKVGDFTFDELVSLGWKANGNQDDGSLYIPDKGPDIDFLKTRTGQAPFITLSQFSGLN